MIVLDRGFERRAPVAGIELYQPDLVPTGQMPFVLKRSVHLGDSISRSRSEVPSDGIEDIKVVMIAIR
jgi:hypothetical protein